MIPPKLKAGDEIRIIAPSRSLSIISKDSIKIAETRLRGLGFKVSYSKHAYETDEFKSSSIESRVKDMNDAFQDDNVNAILAAIGGFNSNQILRYLDYRSIKSNPKIMCGFSDITALSNAIYAKTGLVTYSGPHFSTFGMKKGFDYSLEYFKKCLMSSGQFEVHPSKSWSDDKWYENQEKRSFVKNKGYLVINHGEAEGKIVGANLVTFNHLQGTEYMPSLKGKIVFVEDDYEEDAIHFDSNLQSLILHKDFDKVKGMIIGRFQKESKVSNEMIMKIIKTKKELNDLPVVANFDFGHTTPQITFPIGGTAKLYAGKGKANLTIREH
jgi:muramoyltetrapeptide carboxypeptidase LdcA involved in peptidoglycan recycling